MGLPWLAAFVLVPAAATALARSAASAGLQVALVNVGLLAAVVVIFGSGVIRAVTGALHGLLSELGASFSSTLRSLPLLVLFALVLFGTTETWQIFAALPAPFVPVVFSLFWGLALLFVVLRLRAQIDVLVKGSISAGPPLRPRERLYLAVMLVVREGLQVFVVAVGVAGFFVAYGALTVGAQVYDAWGITAGSWTWRPLIRGYPLVFSETLLRVTAAIASVCGLYYVIAILTDGNYREDFLARVAADVKVVFEARTRYLELRRHGVASEPPAVRDGRAQ